MKIKSTLSIILILNFFCLAQESISVQKLKGTTWQSDDRATTLVFVNEMQVIRVKGDKQIPANYFVENGLVIITNGFVKIPLTYSKGILKGYLTAGQGETILRKK